MSEIKIFTDGGSRGNPGPAAAAFIVKVSNKEIFSNSKFLGVDTNNFAEYSAVIIALEWLDKNYKKNGFTKVNFILDSELVVRQLNKIYKVKNSKIKVLYEDVVKKLSDISCKFTFTSVTRDKNHEADKLVNQTLDKAS